LFSPTLVLDITDGLLHPWAHVRAVSVTLVFGVLLALGYISLRVLLAHPQRSES
jgi:hypothetical protein